MEMKKAERPPHTRKAIQAIEGEILRAEMGLPAARGNWLTASGNVADDYTLRSPAGIGELLLPL